VAVACDKPPREEREEARERRDIYNNTIVVKYYILTYTPDWRNLMTQGLRRVRLLILMQEFEKGGTESGI